MENSSEKMLAELKKLKQQIEGLLEKKKSRLNIPMDKIGEIFENQANFSKDKWDQLQKEKKEFDKKFKKYTEFVPKSLQKKLDKQKEKSTHKTSLNRSRKRKDWLSL